MVTGERVLHDSVASLARRRVLSALYAVFFVSGFSTLLYQTTWQRMLALMSDPQGAYVAFDPISILVEAGTTIHRTCDANVHTTTAYPPKDGHHCLRIPTEA